MAISDVFTLDMKQDIVTQKLIRPVCSNVQRGVLFTPQVNYLWRTKRYKHIYILCTTFKLHNLNYLRHSEKSFFYFNWVLPNFMGVLIRLNFIFFTWQQSTCCHITHQNSMFNSRYILGIEKDVLSNRKKCIGTYVIDKYLLKGTAGKVILILLQSYIQILSQLISVAQLN